VEYRPDRRRVLVTCLITLMGLMSVSVGHSTGLTAARPQREEPVWFAMSTDGPTTSRVVLGPFDIYQGCLRAVDSAERIDPRHPLLCKQSLAIPLR